MDERRRGPVRRAAPAGASRGAEVPLAHLTRLRAFFLPDTGGPRPLPAAIVAALGVGLGAALALADLPQRLDWAIYDRFVQAAARGAPPAPGIVVVAIDEPSLAEVAVPWPWPRRLHAALIDRLAEAGARTIAVDILFDRPGGSQADDEMLVRAVQRAGNVVLVCDLSAIADRAYTLAQWSDPFPALASAAAGVGGAGVTPDPDGVLRRAAPVIAGRPSLAAATAAREPGFRPPADPDAPRLISFNGPSRRGIVTVSYYQALDPDRFLPPGVFEDRIVLVGWSLHAASEEVSDQFATPVGRMGGVEVHANVVDTLLRGRAIAEPAGSATGLLLVCVALGLVGAAVFYKLEMATALVATLGCSLAYLMVGYASLARAAVRLPIVPPVVAVGCVLAATSAYRAALVSRERRVIRRAFEHYVSPAIVAEMLADPSRLKLGGQQYEVTVLFTDLEGSTALAEQLSPPELRAYLSRHFEEMMTLLLAERATLDKFIGDSIMVYFGCPIVEADHALRACRSALAMQDRMDQLRADWTRAGLPALRMRIGVNTGRVVAGNMGTDTIFNYTILGDCVNVASRLEGINKVYGTRIIIGEDTRSQVQDAFELRELDWIRVKGREQPVGIYELVAPLGQTDEARRRVLAEFATGLALYRAARWQEAARALRRALELDRHDGPSRTLLARCEAYAATPPPAWDGVFVMQSK